jgi:O-antigen/teichoic acid export membrane protein
MLGLCNRPKGLLPGCAASEDPVFSLIQVFRQRLLSGFAWNLVAAVAGQGSVLLASMIVARIVGVKDFGAYAFLVTLVLTLAAIGQAGSGLVAAKFVAEFAAQQPERAARVLVTCRWFTLGTGILLGTVLLIAAVPVARALLGDAEPAAGVRWAALAVALLTAQAYTMGTLQGLGAFQRLSRVGVWSGLAHIVLSVAGAWWAGVAGAMAGYAAACAVRSLLLRRAMRAQCRESGIACTRQELDVLPPERGTDLPLMWRVGLPAALSGLVTMPCQWAVTWLVSREDAGLAAVALFSVSLQLKAAVSQLPALLNHVSFSQLSRHKQAEQGAIFSGIIRSSMAVNFAFSILAATLLSFLAGPLLSLYGSDFKEGRYVLVVLLVSVVPEIMTLTLYQLVQSAGRMWRSLFAISMPRDALLLLAAAVCVPRFGVIGASIAFLISQVAAFGFTVAVARWCARNPELHLG